MGGALGLRRKAVEHDVGRRAEWKIAACLACAERDAGIDGRPELEELPAVDLAVEISRRLVDRSGVDVVHQPLRAHDVAVDVHLERRLGAGAAGKRRLADEYDVSEVENVVDQQLIVALHVKRAVSAAPASFDVLAEVGDQRWIGKRSLAEPHENKAMDFARGKTSCAEIAADGGIPWHVGASAVGGEADAVIAALDVVADDLAGGERRLAVGAAIGERGGGPVPRAKDDQRLVADRPRQRLGAEFGGSCGGVPLIAKEWGHLCPPPVIRATIITLPP